MNIYLYGGKSFKEEMKNMLKDAYLLDISEEINSPIELEDKINLHPNDIYLIDNDKIITSNIINKKLNFLKPKDSIDKKILEKIGIDDMCFNSNEALLSYIINKIDNDNNELNIENNTDIEMINVQKERNMNDITIIEDIMEEDILSALDIDNENISEDNTKISTDEIKIPNDASTKEIKNNNNLEISAANVDEVTELIRQLLNNKTVELSIKIKEN